MANLLQRKYIFVLVDALTRFTFVRALEDKSAITVAKAMHSFILEFTSPQEIISDNGSEFINQVFASLASLFEINHAPVLAYRPSANGLVERHNKSIVGILRHLVIDRPTSWPEMLASSAYSLNTAYNSSVGDTPYFLMFQQEYIGRSKWK